MLATITTTTTNPATAPIIASASSPAPAYFRPFDIEGIFIAHCGAEKMTKQGGYRFERDEKSARKATVITPEGKRYGCNIGSDFWYCGCPVCCERGICKHQVPFAR